MENNNIAKYVNIFACAIQKLLKDPFNCALFKYYKVMKGGTGSTLSRTKYVKSFRVETSCSRLVLQLNFIVTVELCDQAESDFVQCQTKMRAFAYRICSEFKQIELN